MAYLKSLNEWCRVMLGKGRLRGELSDFCRQLFGQMQATMCHRQVCPLNESEWPSFSSFF